MKSIDKLLWGTLLLIVAGYIAEWQFAEAITYRPLAQFTGTMFEMVNTIWWGVLIGIMMISVLGRVPRDFVISALGTDKGIVGLVRAVIAGVLLDLCNHGVLMVGAKLYERGATTGQVIAFLVASPWNSFSLTLVLIALIGLPWTLGFIGLSMVIALITGLLFDWLVKGGRLPPNPAQHDLPADFSFWREAKSGLSSLDVTPGWLFDMFREGLMEARMVLRWIFLGVVLAGALRAVLSPDQFETFFGPTLMGLAITMGVATILEVCSEGSAPIAADILNRAGAPGNGFAFLMTGVSTDYTEIMILRETTGSWKIPLFLPLLTVPQVLLIAWLMNQF
ncbi:MAG: permease [Gammaproteobacteria bacterium]|nr:permease [Gammaproteobacteria bacterium]